MDPLTATDEGALKRALLHDISSFLHYFPSDFFITYSAFRAKWDELDFNLLAIVAGTDSIITCLIQLGLFGPTRSFRDHQLLVFFLFSLYKGAGRRSSSLKVSADRMQFLVGLRIGARRMAGEGDEVVAALEALFKVDAFVITAGGDEAGKYISSLSPSAAQASSGTSMDQLIDRINRIDNFLHQHPLFSPSGSSVSLSRTALTRLKDSFERYYESKKRNNVLLGDEQDFGTLLGSVGKIVEGYEKLIQKRKAVASNRQSPSAINAPTASQSIRSRLSQSSLNPIIPSSSSSSPPLFIPQISMSTVSRAQSVPAGNKRKASASLKEIDLDEFLDTSNMPNLNFY